MSSRTSNPLPEGYQLRGYVIEKTLSSGGFSIVYLARDGDERPVAIKEYLPANLAMRAEEERVVAISMDHLAGFRHGMKCFFEEGRALATINHPNVVRVENFFRANDTVYMVMQYMRGRTLQHHIKSHRKRFGETFMRRTFSSLLNGLREVHLRKLLHLDIKPANIYVTLRGLPVLLDFGAARNALHNDGPILKPMYTQGYAAPEQYRGLQGLGPWTDVYSIGATMYACLSANPPPAADARLKDDRHVPAVKQFAGRFTTQLLEIIDSCLRLEPTERPQSVFALQKALMQMPEREPRGIEPAFEPLLRDPVGAGE